MVPEHLLIHDVTVVRPAEIVDDYGNVTYDYIGGTRSPIRAWMQQQARQQDYEDGRSPDTERWLMVSNYSDVLPHDHIEWSAPNAPGSPLVFELDGPAEPAYAGLSGQYHHLEVFLRHVGG